MDILGIMEKSEDCNSTKFRQPEFDARTSDGPEWWKAIHEKDEPK